MINESIYEDGNGGQLLLKNNNIAQTSSIYTLAYLKMFGGNIEASTVKNNVVGAIRNDWWGNDVNENSSEWINSETERTLKGIALTTKNIYRIQQAVKKDLKSLEEFGAIEISITYPDINRVSIEILIKEPERKDNNRLIVIWDNTKNEIVNQEII